MMEHHGWYSEAESVVVCSCGWRASSSAVAADDLHRHHVRMLTEPPERTNREGDSQGLPTPNDGPVIQDLVIEDIKDRLAVGIIRYGTGLQPNNGRNALLDLYEELLDGAMYIKQRLVEEDPLADVLLKRVAVLEEALRLTQEYVGEDVLPSIAGWAWWDAIGCSGCGRPDVRWNPYNGVAQCLNCGQVAS